MSVAKCLGVDDVDGPAMKAAAVAWKRWCHQNPELAVVDDVLDLSKWTRRVPATTKDPLLAHLHLLAQQDAEAAVVLAWLMLPGATRVANGLRDLSPDIDALTAGELWLQIRNQPVERCVAATILRRVRRALLDELGHGDSARRSDKTWANTWVCDDDAVLESLASVPDLETNAESESGHLIQAALLAGAISFQDASLLHRLATAADEHATPSRRGRGGLTAPKAVESAMRFGKIPTRTARRRAATSLDQLGAFARDEHIVDDLRDFVATHDLPPVELAELLELYFWAHIDEHAAQFNYPA
ncbi:hypothetical protein [Nocardioides allogilvus]|uniref:hypothetical protein n=1 Tax=Nocardioides allogilvus TaxID=2072017 RepID=UPI000D3191F0|nr:hypothetical protein [Nocardioides allogilvus]